MQCIKFQVISLSNGEAVESICKFFNRKSISRNFTHPFLSPEILYLSPALLVIINVLVE